jgi:hypothetical protein
MWVSDRHPDRERLLAQACGRAEAPKPSGETLAQLLRRGPNGVEQRLRVALDSYEGHEYVSVRLWEGGRPTKKGCSFRMAELPIIVAALQEAMGRAARAPAPETTREEPTREAPRRRQRPEGRRRWAGAGTPPAPRGHDDDAY